MENIRENRDILLSKIKQTHKNSFYCNLKVPKLVAVSKKQDNYKIDQAIECGQKYFGENRVQEASKRSTVGACCHEPLHPLRRNCCRGSAA